VLAAIVVLVPARGGAQTSDPRAVQPERPSVATHAFTVAPGIVEIEAGVERAYEDGRYTGTSLPFTVKLGLAERVQLAIGGSMSWPASSDRRFDEISVGVKWRLSERAPLAGAIAVLSSVTVPAGAARASSNNTVGVLLIASRSIAGISLDLNAGYARTIGGQVDADAKEALWAVSLGGPIAGRFGWFGELSGVRTMPADDTAAHVAGALAGATVSVSPSLVVDVAIVLPTAGADGRAVVTGLSWNVCRLWSR
jgi:hypothetical protein